MHVWHVRLLLPLSLLAAVACSSSSNQETTGVGTADSTSADPEILELNCSDASGLKIDVAKYGASGFNVYITPAGATASEPIEIFCFGPGISHTPSIGVCNSAVEGWYVTVDAVADGYTVSAKQGESAPASTLTCTPPPRPDAPIPTYAEVAPIIQQTCSSCHHDEFGSLERVKAMREQMHKMIGGGYMPTYNFEWYESPKGQKVLDFLRHSPEL